MKEYTKKYIQRNAKNTRKTNISNKSIIDYQFYIGTNKQASEYENASDFMINYIKKTFDRGNDIALKTQNTDNWIRSATLKTKN